MSWYYIPLTNNLSYANLHLNNVHAFYWLNWIKLFCPLFHHLSWWRFELMLLSFGFIIFCPYLQMEGKPSSTQGVSFLTFSCQLKVSDPMSDVSQFDNYTKFAVECKWNKDFSNTYAIWIFFWKLQIFQRLVKIGKGGKCAVECVSNDIIFQKCLFLLNWGFAKKSEKF